jgi:16S rRNA (cytosine1402-N4)-methyltransferase
MYHKPVLLHESLEGLRISPEGTYADLTFGGGGHSVAILGRLTTGRLIVFDQDRRALENAPADDRLVPVSANFRYLLHFLRYHDALPVDGIIADLGVSSHQIDTPERGFTTRTDAPLDMRMNPAASLTAAEVIAGSTEERLADVLYQYGELRNARQMAAALCARRSVSPITTANHLREALVHCIPSRQEHKFMARIFQALRIEVNDELGALREMLMQCAEAIKPGGRLVVLSYHSLEDRLVKRFIRSGTFSDRPETDFFGRVDTPFTPVVSGAVKPTGEEISENNRARSARLRIGERN